MAKQKDIIIDELDRLRAEFKHYQSKREVGSHGEIFYEGSVNGVSSAIERIENLFTDN